MYDTARFAASILVAAVFGACAAPTGAFRKDLLGSGIVAGVRNQADKPHLNELSHARKVEQLHHTMDWSYARGFVEGDLESVEYYYGAHERPLAGIIATPRIPAGVIGWEAQGAALGLRVIEFAGMLRHGELDEDIQKRLGKERLWPEYELVYTTDTPHVFVTIAENSIQRIIREVRPRNFYPGKPEEDMFHWISDDKPVTLMYSFEQLKRSFAEEEAQGKVYRGAEIRRDLLASAVTEDIRAYMGAAATVSDEWRTRYDRVVAAITSNNEYTAAETIALASEYLRAYPEMLRRVDSTAFRDDLNQAFRRRIAPLSQLARDDERLATAAVLEERLWRIENLRGQDPEPVTIDDAVTKPGLPLADARKLAATVFFKSMPLPIGASEAAFVAVGAIWDGNPDNAQLALHSNLTKHFGLTMGSGMAMSSIATTLETPRILLIEQPLLSSLSARYYAKQTTDERIVERVETEADLARYERDLAAMLAASAARQKWTEGFNAGMKEWLDTPSTRKFLGEERWEEAIGAEKLREALEERRREADLRARGGEFGASGLDPNAPVPGRIRQRLANVKIRMVCESWSGDLTRALELDPDGTPVRFTRTISAGNDEEFCLEVESDVPADKAFQWWTKEQAEYWMARKLDEALSNDVRAEIERRRRFAAAAFRDDTPLRVRADPSESVLEIAYLDALLCSGKWPDPALPER